MSRSGNFWGLTALSLVLGLAMGYALARPTRESYDMMDAVAAVQRHSPRFLVSEPCPNGGYQSHSRWTHRGTVYLCRKPMTAFQAQALNKFAVPDDPNWKGVLCIQGTIDPALDVSWVSRGKGRRLRYQAFAVTGHPSELDELQAILAKEGALPLDDR